MALLPFLGQFLFSTSLLGNFVHIYISPHHDDICFSLGALASRQGGELINIFTRSQYVAVDMHLPTDHKERIEKISNIRLQEDINFVNKAKLDRYDLLLEEPRLIGCQPFDLTNLAAAVARTSKHLIPYIFDMLPKNSDPRDVNLYCPVGIGGHRDHVSTAITIRDAYEQLCKRCSIHLYEDLHYASVPQLRERGLRQAAQLYSGYSLSPTFHVLDPNEAKYKMELVSLYKSQHPELPNPPKFTPASGLSSRMHEIVWSIKK